MTVFRDPSAKWAGEEVGGIRVSHLSHIDGPFKLALRESQKKTNLHLIEPLPDVAPPAPVNDKRAALVAEWPTADPERQKVIEAEVKAIDAQTEAPQ